MKGVIGSHVTVKRTAHRRGDARMRTSTAPAQCPVCFKNMLECVCQMDAEQAALDYAMRCARGKFIISSRRERRRVNICEIVQALSE
jgi:hypothetical protein